MMFGMLTFGLSACDDDDEEKVETSGDEEKVETPSDTSVSYLGQMVVAFQGTNIPTDSVNVVANVNKDSSLVSLDWKKVKFVPQMPVTIDLSVPNITAKKESGKIVFAADSIIPTMLGNEVAKYAASDIKGEIFGDSISLSLKFGSFPTSYKGILKK